MTPIKVSKNCGKMDDVSNLKIKYQFAESNNGYCRIVRFIKSLQIYGVAKLFLSNIFYWPFKGGASFVAHLCYFLSCFLLCFLARPFINVLWSPARKGLFQNTTTILPIKMHTLRQKCISNLLALGQK